MSLVPLLVNELLRESCDPFSRLYDQNFGIGLLDDDFYRRPAFPTSVLSGYLRPHRHVHPEESGVSTVSNQKDQLKVSLDVQQFKPEEVSVKIVDGFLVVEGKHEEKADKHGFIARQFTRRYKLPENVKVDAIKSSLSSDGILLICAPKKIEESTSKEIRIPVVKTNQPAIKQTKASDVGSGEKMQM